MIPVILKGETSKPIQLTLREGYVYSGCVLAVCFRGVMKTFTDLVAGGTVELLYTAEETSTFPLGTGKVGLSIQNSAGDICFMPWAKIKVTDSPDEVHDAQITIDPATLNVSDATSKDSLGAVKSKLNAVLAFLRGLSSLAVLALPLYALSDVAPLTAPLDDIPGDTPIMTNVVPYVDAKVAAVPAPDYSTGNAALVATIEATASAPGDYETVSNKAMSALQEHQSLWPAVEASTNYTDAALGAFAETGTVARAAAYGTTERWTDSHGRVWEKAYSDWEVEYDDPDMAHYGVRIVATGQGDGAYWIPYVGDNPAGVAKGNADSTEIVWLNAAITDFKATRTFLGATNLVGRVALTNDISQAISTNNAAFVSAVLAVPLTGADADDLAEVAEYGGYGTVGAAILALIAGLAALKRRVTSAETALAQKASASDLPYRLVEPGKWAFSGLPSGVTVVDFYFDITIGWLLFLSSDPSLPLTTGGTADDLIVSFLSPSSAIIATRPSLTGHLCDRAGNLVVVSGDTTLTLPATNPGYLRDFLVRLEISGSTVPTITFAAPTGETITYETDGDEFPVPDEAGTWSYSFTENCVAHKFAVSLKKVNEVAAPQAQGGA